MTNNPVALVPNPHHSGHPMTPELKARQNIDAQLVETGWLVQDAREMFISAGLGVAIREFALADGEADYLLYVDSMAAGIVEAKPEGHTLRGVEEQSKKYLNGLPDGIPAYAKPLPFHYESTGKETHFTNLLDPDPRSRAVFRFRRPEELQRLAGLEKQHRALLREMPALDIRGLWHVQERAVSPRVDSSHSRFQLLPAPGSPRATILTRTLFTRGIP